ncbi:MAG: hypothetical protein ACFFCQ_12665 [Promethearchaeota archaeon]
MSMKGIHGVLVCDVGTSDVKASVYYLDGSASNQWESNLTFKNEITKISDKDVRQMEATGQEVPPIFQFDGNHKLFTPLELGKLKMFGTPMDVLDGATHTDPDYLRASYQHICQKLSKEFKISNKLGFDLDSKPERRNWGVFSTITQFDPKRKIKEEELLNLHKNIITDLGFGYFYARNQTTLSVIANGTKIKQTNPEMDCILIDVGGGDMKGFGLVTEVISGRPQMIPLPGSMRRETLAGKRIEDYFVENARELVKRGGELRNTTPFLNYLYGKSGKACGVKCYDPSKNDFLKNPPPMRILREEVSVPEKLRCTPTMLFEPENYNLPDLNGVQTVCDQIVEEAEVQGSSAESLLKCVLLVGGTVKYHNVVPRMKEELRKLYSSISDINVVLADVPKYSVVVGQRLTLNTVVRKQRFFDVFEKIN